MSTSALASVSFSVISGFSASTSCFRVSQVFYQCLALYQCVAKCFVARLYWRVSKRVDKRLCCTLTSVCPSHSASAGVSMSGSLPITASGSMSLSVSQGVLATTSACASVSTTLSLLYGQHCRSVSHSLPVLACQPWRRPVPWPLSRLVC